MVKKERKQELLYAKTNYFRCRSWGNTVAQVRLIIKLLKERQLLFFSLTHFMPFLCRRMTCSFIVFLVSGDTFTGLILSIYSQSNICLRFDPIANPLFSGKIILAFIQDAIDDFVFPANVRSKRSNFRGSCRFVGHLRNNVGKILSHYRNIWNTT